MALPLTPDRPNVAAAALGNNRQDVYAVHLVNNGATRQVTLTGLPASVRKLRVFTTDHARAMQKGKRVKVRAGTATFALDASCYTTLLSR